MKVLILSVAFLSVLDLTLKSETVKIWQDLDTGKGAQNVTLTIHLPNTNSVKAPAVVICPGGGYGTCVMSYEGNEVGEWFSKRGFAAFVLKYRVSPYRHPLPRNDVQQAIKYVRKNAKKYKVDPEKLGVMGFSAGGHLAATAGTQFTDLSDRPDFMILAYPVISMKKGITHGGSRINLLGVNPNQKLVERMSLETQVNSKTPRTFIFHTDEDSVVPAENALLFISSLRKFGVPCEFHLFQKGRHGVGLGREGNKKWSLLLEDWLRRLGYMES
tara:strand:- start:53 stop:868 length:816 start_codon:yes stop_codon:yes gene_type:complete